MDPEKGYTKDNIIVLCPNHHTEIEMLYTDPCTQWSLTDNGKEILRLLKQKKG